MAQVELAAGEFVRSSGRRQPLLSRFASDHQVAANSAQAPLDTDETSERKNLVMLFWTRELAGWLLVGLALYLIWLGLEFLTDFANPKIVEAGIVMLTGLGVLRIGVLLIRISAAARLCLRDQTSPNRADRTAGK